MDAKGWFMGFLGPEHKSELQPLIFWGVCEDESGNDFITGFFTSPSGKLMPSSLVSGSSLTGYEYHPNRFLKIFND